MKKIPSSPAAAARFWGVSRTSIYRWIRDGVDYTDPQAMSNLYVYGGRLPGHLEGRILEVSDELRREKARKVGVH